MHHATDSRRVSFDSFVYSLLSLNTQESKAVLRLPWNYNIVTLRQESVKYQQSAQIAQNFHDLIPRYSLHKLGHSNVFHNTVMISLLYFDPQQIHSCCRVNKERIRFLFGSSWFSTGSSCPRSRFYAFSSLPLTMNVVSEAFPSTGKGPSHLTPNFVLRILGT